MSCYEIIRRVQEHPEIWKFSHPLHRTRKAHTAFWRKLAADLGCSDEVVRRKWKHLLDQFRKEAKKAMQKDLPDEVICWEYYNALSFLKPEIILRERERAQGFLPGYTPEIEGEGDVNEESVAEASPDSKEEAVRVKKQRRNSESEDSSKVELILKRVTETKALVEKNTTTTDDTTKNDPDCMYLMSLVPYIKQLSELEKLQFRGVANDWLLKTLSNKNNTILPDDDDTVFQFGSEIKGETVDQ